MIMIPEIVNKGGTNQASYCNIKQAKITVHSSNVTILRNADVITG